MSRVVIVGRTNVGKSSLFNRLLGQKRAIINNNPNVTRDSIEIFSERLGCYLVDTAGINEEIILTQFVAQAKRAVVGSVLILFVVDGKSGLLPEDRYVMQQIRAINKDNIKIVLVVNKIDCKATGRLRDEFKSLGVGEGIGVSAEHNIGIVELVNIIRSTIQPISVARPYINIAVIGQPNAGKSSLINWLAGCDRVAVSNIAGTTREAVDVTFNFHDKLISIVDNAGTRRRYLRDKSELENMSLTSALHAIERADVVILVMDASTGYINSQDLRLADLVKSKLKPLVIAANKADVAKELPAVMEKLGGIAKDLFLGTAVIAISAKTGANCNKLISETLRIKSRAQKKIPQTELNKWLSVIDGEHSMAVCSASRIKRMVQCSVVPQIFNVYINTVKDRLGTAYERHLVKNLRKTFGMEGVPIVLRVVKSKNPYVVS